jgi:hypothetical protein
VSKFCPHGVFLPGPREAAVKSALTFTAKNAMARWLHRHRRVFLKETRMSVNNISSNNAGALLQAFTQRKQDLASLASALGSGDVASAQTALSAFQQDLQNLPSQAQDPATQSALASDLKLLQSDLNSNNVSDARNVFSNLLQDLQNVQHGHRHHGHQQYTNHNSNSWPNSLTPDANPIINISA